MSGSDAPGPGRARARARRVGGAILATVFGCVAAPSHADGVDAVMARFRPSAPGCALGVSRRGEPTLVRGYGLADLEHAAPITPGTVFEAGSVSKQVTAAAVLLLVRDGRIKLSDDIRKYLPEMPDYGAPITVDNLLSHTSGLRDWGEVAALTGWPRGSRIYTNEEALQIATRQKALNYRPGAAYSYTNTGYTLAAIIVGRVSGRSFPDFTRARIFEPLGMAQSQWRDDFARVVPGRAQAYAPQGGGQRLDMPFEDGVGNGGLLTTVGDLLIWNDALTRGALGAPVVGAMQRRAVLSDGRTIAYARGLFVTAHDGVREVSHGGATGGYRAWLGRYPDQGLSIALLCNGADADAARQAHAIADLYLSRSPAPAPAPRPTSAEELSRRPGLYVQEGAMGLVRLEREGEHLRQKDGPALTPIGPARYQAGPDTFAFLPGGGLERRGADGGVDVFRREAPAAPGASELAPLAGTYASDEAAATVRVALRGGELIVAPSDRPSAAEAMQPLFKDGFTYPGGGLVRVVRGPGGQVEGLRYQGSRVWDLVLRRIGP